MSNFVVDDRMFIRILIFITHASRQNCPYAVQNTLNPIYTAQPITALHSTAASFQDKDAIVCRGFGRSTQDFYMHAIKNLPTHTFHRMILSEFISRLNVWARACTCGWIEEKATRPTPRYRETVRFAVWTCREHDKIKQHDLPLAPVLDKKTDDFEMCRRILRVDSLCAQGKGEIETVGSSQDHSAELAERLKTTGWPQTIAG